MKEYVTHTSIVAFIDILGASSKIQKNSSETLKIVHNAYDDALSAFHQVCDKTKISPQIRIFSDNIVISKECKEENIRDAFYMVVMLSAMIQEKLLSHNISVRGGIAKGDFFSDNVMIWGDALVLAYELENSVAIYPRIIIHPKLVGELQLLNTHDKQFNQRLFKWIHQDNDGLVYIDYLHDFSCIRNPLVNLLLHMQNTSEEIIKNNDNIKVCQKLLWQQTYLKRKLSELPDEPIDMQNLEGKDTSLIEERTDDVNKYGDK